MSEKKIEFAVKALIFNGNKFLAMHKRYIKSDKFELPGGRMNFGETAEETVIREVFEETNLHITPISLVDTWNYVTDAIQVTGIIYLCAAQNFEKIILSEEHDNFEWFATNKESLERMSNGFKSKMLNWNWAALTDKAAKLVVM
jgi:8-oxo-dGTP pyrophosphatase MutT (NUDIX family)